MNVNELSSAQQERLVLLAEEAAEVIQVVGKILRHGYTSTHPNGGPNNLALLETELGHVEAAKKLLIARGDISFSRVTSESINKLATVQQYLHYNHTNNV